MTRQQLAGAIGLVARTYRHSVLAVWTWTIEKYQARIRHLQILIIWFLYFILLSVCYQVQLFMCVIRPVCVCHYVCACVCVCMCMCACVCVFVGGSICLCKYLFEILRVFVAASEVRLSLHTNIYIPSSFIISKSISRCRSAWFDGHHQTHSYFSLPCWMYYPQG